MRSCAHWQTALATGAVFATRPTFANQLGNLVRDFTKHGIIHMFNMRPVYEKWIVADF